MSLVEHLTEVTVTDLIEIERFRMTEEIKRIQAEERIQLALVLLEGSDSDLRLGSAPSWAAGKHTSKGRGKVKSLTATQRARLAAMVLTR